MIRLSDLRQIRDGVWEIPKSYRNDMRCSARVFVSRKSLEKLLDEKSIWQLVNVATLPGVEHAFAMPDIHQGYGFPIGGVAAIRKHDGVISPGGVGYDINCGVRLLKSPFTFAEIRDYLEELASEMQKSVPSGVGRGGPMRLGTKELDEVLDKGCDWAVKRGFGSKTDQDFIEERGAYRHANSEYVSEQAKKRGADQLGTIGSGNHFVEIQHVVEVSETKAADTFGLFPDQVVIMIHTGSRGLGHQICTDYVRLMNQVRAKYQIEIPDRELACAPYLSDEGQQYFGAMAAAANYAWANRQIITHRIRETWQEVLRSGHAGNLSVLYDVAHNIAKLETHGEKEYIVHRKGATRAFGPKCEGIPKAYWEVGQPVLIPGSMGTFSYVLSGTSGAMSETFGSSCHGAGRAISRMKAKKTIEYNSLRKELDDYGVVVRAGSRSGLLEEAPAAYKNIDEVVGLVQSDGLAKVVAKLRPVAVIKG